MKKKMISKAFNGHQPPTSARQAPLGPTGTKHASSRHLVRIVCFTYHGPLKQSFVPLEQVPVDQKSCFLKLFTLNKIKPQVLSHEMSFRNVITINLNIMCYTYYRVRGGGLRFCVHFSVYAGLYMLYT